MAVMHTMTPSRPVL